MLRFARRYSPAPSLAEQFGVQSLEQLRRDYSEMIRDGLRGRRFQFDITSAGLLRPDLAWPTYCRLVRKDGLSPIFNLFDRNAGGHEYSQRVSRRDQTDFRGGRLSYDQHDGVDFVIPAGTLLCAAAPGTCVMIRHRWLRGGLTIALDHGNGVLTHYTHCSRSLVTPGQRVRRGESIAISGTSGVDMTQFFPWIPPHVHFMSWHLGTPIDPYRQPNEPDAPGTWLTRNRPGHDRIPGESIPPASPVDAAAMQEAIDTCADTRLRAELDDAVRLGPIYAAALLEEMLHHERFAWPAAFANYRVRPRKVRATNDVRLSLPLRAQDYAGAFFADTASTRPRGPRR